MEVREMLKKMAVGLYQANCYVLGSKTTMEGIVIDPGDEAPRIAEVISRAGLKIRYILLTHEHFDHTGAALEIKKTTGAPVLIHPLDARGLQFVPDGHIVDRQELPLGELVISVIHTPGHSPGGICLYTHGAVFTGDTLFAGSVGRTDFPGGDHKGLIHNVVEKIFPLGDDVRVYPGHGPHSVIGRERQSNPFFRQWRTA
jgi:glyoxylase-like metal-dependent hydrolase (beta-lactamase superfamily II)